MVARKPLTNPRIGKTTPTYLRFPEYLRYYLDRKCDWRREQGENAKLIDIIVESIQNGEYYKEDLAKSVEELFAAEPAIRNRYYEQFAEKRPHHSYVTEEPLDVETLAVSSFIREAIDEKIARDAPGFNAKSKEQRMERWHWLHSAS